MVEGEKHFRGLNEKIEKTQLARSYVSYESARSQFGCPRCKSEHESHHHDCPDCFSIEQCSCWARKHPCLLQLRRSPDLPQLVHLLRCLLPALLARSCWCDTKILLCTPSGMTAFLAPASLCPGLVFPAWFDTIRTWCLVPGTFILQPSVSHDFSEQSSSTFRQQKCVGFLLTSPP